MTSKIRRSRDRRLTCERLEPRALLAWKVLAADAETLTIGDPEDGDVGVLSFDPTTDHFLLDGIDTGVKPESRGGLPNVFVSTGGASNSVFVIDAGDNAFPALGGCLAFGDCTPLGTSIRYDGTGIGNAMRFSGDSVYLSSVTLRPFNGLGTVTFNAGYARNEVFYRNFNGKIALENVGAITVDVSQESIQDPMYPMSQITRDPRQSIYVDRDRIFAQEHKDIAATCVDPPECREFIAPTVLTDYDIVDVQYDGATQIELLAGDGDDWLGFGLDEPAVVDSKPIRDYRFTAKGGDGNDRLNIHGSSGNDAISLTRLDEACLPFVICEGFIVLPESWPQPPEFVTTLRALVADIEYRDVNGASGDDWITGSSENDALNGGLGSDFIRGEAGDDIIIAGEQNDVVLGGSGNDSVSDGPGDDTVDGGSGADVLLAGAPGLPDNIRVYPAGLAVPALTTLGIDFRRSVTLWLNTDPELSALGDDQLSGGDGDDLLFGTAGSNSLRGGLGNDVLVGADGDDRLEGGEGRNLMIAGRGRDVITSLGNDIVITGSTTLDANVAALRAILAEWAADRPLAVRVRNLTDGTGSTARLNGDYFLDSTTVMADGDRDTGVARRRIDWLLASFEDFISIPRRRRRPVRMRIVSGLT